MKKRHSEHVRGIVDGLINQLEKKTVKKGMAVIEAWNRSVGETAYSHSRPVSFKKGVLVVVVENSTWLYKLTLEKKKIVDTFNKEYEGRTKVEDIRFRIGTFGE